MALRLQASKSGKWFCDAITLCFLIGGGGLEFCKIARCRIGLTSIVKLVDADLGTLDNRYIKLMELGEP